MNTTGLYNYPGRIRTFTGKFIDPFELEKDDLDINDIAHALSHIPRFGGHAQGFISVAQHSVMVSGLLPNELKLAGLLHDASEAYLLDIPSPLKERMLEYTLAESKIQISVALKWRVDIFSKAVKEADRKALEFEWANGVIHKNMEYNTPTQAKAKFLALFYKLTHDK